MYELWLVVLSTALVNNVVLTSFIGTDTPLGDGASRARAHLVGWTSGAALIVAGTLAWCLDRWLVAPLAYPGLRLWLFALLAAAVSLLVERAVRTRAPLRAWRANGRVPLIAANSIVLGGMLLTLLEPTTLPRALATLVGVAAGFVLCLNVLGALAERVAAADVPAAFRGGAITLVTLGLVALALGGLVGIGDG